MGDPSLDSYSDPERLRRFTKRLLTDLRALERMIEEGRLESGVRRIGAEQELVLVDRSWHPCARAEEVLARLDPRVFAPELGRFNVEFRLDPLPFAGDCLSRLEAAFHARLAEVRTAAAAHGALPVMAGILPTLRKSDLGLHNMVDRPRFHALDAALRKLRGGDFDLRLTGTDELILKHRNVMLEACNTSCQFHFQVGPEEFARAYNIAQAVTAPVLAAAVNSPLLFGRRLWRETRIALFQQAVDTRPTGENILDRSARVSFGESWVRESVLEIFREDVARFRVVLGIDVDEDALEVLDAGGLPHLTALQMHNGTVYRWNRPCYGCLDGRATLRIENRALPAGPSVFDQVSNGAFWFGLVSGLAAEHEDITRVLDFDVAKSNFLAASRQGLDAQFEWIGRKLQPARTLIRRTLLPLAREGLLEAGLERDDVERYLDGVLRRVATRRTGACWTLDSLAAMPAEAKPGEKMTALVAAMRDRQERGLPVHRWKLATLDEAGSPWRSYRRVEEYMTTELFTVHEGEIVDLVAHVMDWKHIRHVPVENDEGRLVGLVSYRALLRLLARELPAARVPAVPVTEIMTREVVTVGPDTDTLEAIEIMRQRKVACLPVVADGRLVGIVSERDFLRIAADLLLRHLQAEGADP